MRIIAFITDGPTVRDILGHLGEPTTPPRIAPARGPAVGGRRRRARSRRRSAAPVRPGLRVRPAPQLVATTVTVTVAAHPCAPPGGLVPAPARLPARGHAGVRARPKVPQQACGAARCRRKWTIDSTDRLAHTQARALEMAMRDRCDPRRPAGQRQRAARPSRGFLLRSRASGQAHRRVGVCRADGAHRRRLEDVQPPGDEPARAVADDRAPPRARRGAGDVRAGAGRARRRCASAMRRGSIPKPVRASGPAVPDWFQATST
jgi:hypothetical protein